MEASWLLQYTGMVRYEIKICIYKNLLKCNSKSTSPLNTLQKKTVTAATDRCLAVEEEVICALSNGDIAGDIR